MEIETAFLEGVFHETRFKEIYQMCSGCCAQRFTCSSDNGGNEGRSPEPDREFEEPAERT